jgi:hypothetical protein
MGGPASLRFLQNISMIKKSFFFLCLSAMLSSGQLFAQQPLWQLQSDSGLTLSVFSQLEPIEINRIHSWELLINDADGRPVTESTIAVEGGMPEHDHGLPTSPRVTAEIVPGRYLLEGVRFHMQGLWHMVFTIDTGDAIEELTLDFDL